MRLLLVPLMLALACDSSSTRPAPQCPTPPNSGIVSKFVLNQMLVPPDRQTYSYDLVGATPAKPLNAFGDVVSALLTANLNMQDGVTKAVDAGSVILLEQVLSTDAALQNGCAVFQLSTGKPTDTMLAAGQTFTIDPTVLPSALPGPISGGKFTSPDTKTLRADIVASVSLPLIPGAAPLAVNLHGAHIIATFSANGMAGQINGAITQKDISGTLIPSVAMILTNKLATDKAAGMLNATDMQILSLFDTGMCTNPDGSMAVAGDMKIDICEVQSNSLIQTVLRPDVQLFDANGNFNPTPNASMAAKDSLSMGIGFSAVPATF